MERKRWLILLLMGLFFFALVPGAIAQEEEEGWKETETQIVTDVPPAGPTTDIDITELEAKLDILQSELDDLGDWMEDWFFWLDARFDQIDVDLQMIFNLFPILIGLLNDLEAKIDTLGGLPLPTPCPPPDRARITYTRGGGPLPDTPWTATVEGTAGAVEPNATVILTSAPAPQIVRFATADQNGAFFLTMTTGNVSYFWFEVAQVCENGETSPPVRILP